VAAHHPDHPPTGDELIERFVDGGVVEGLGDRGIGTHPRHLGPRVGPPVEGRRVAAREAAVQLVGRVQRAPVGVHRHRRELGENDGAVGAQVLVGPPGQTATEEQGAGRVEAHEDLRASAQVDAPHPPPPHAPCAAGDEPVEHGQRLDLDDAPDTTEHRWLRRRGSGR
jgi:hypothetical protein